MPTYVSNGRSTLPFSCMAGVGDVLFLSGQVAIDRESGRLEGADAGAQAAMVLRNMQADLEAEGLGLRHVVKLVIFVKGHMGHAEAVLDACRKALVPPFPAMTCIAVVRLPHPDALVEMEMVVHRNP